MSTDLALFSVLAMWNHGGMDTANLEDAARRYRKAEAALDTARADLQTEAVTFLQRYADERGVQATAVRITGWSREHLRSLGKKAQEEAERARREAEVEALRRKVEELSAPAGTHTLAQEARQASAPPRPARRKSTSTVQEGRPLTDDEAATLAGIVRSRATPLQLQGLEQTVESVPDGLKDFTWVSVGMSMGLLTHDEVYGPVSSEEKTA